MAKLRKFCAYKRLERPYTRISKYRKKSFIRVRPHSKIVKFNMGDPRKKFDITIDLRSKQDIQIRHNAIESGRLACNRYMEKNLGKSGFFFEIRAFPHHILRENPLASGAGADRMSTGMKMSFGKPVGVAAQLRIGSPIFTVSVPKQHVNVARDALKRASKKLPCKCAVVQREEVSKHKVPVKLAQEPAEEKPIEVSVEEQSIEEPKEEPVEEKPAEESKEESAEEPKEESVEEKSAEEPKEESVEKPKEPVKEKPAEEPKEAQTEKSAEEPKATA